MRDALQHAANQIISGTVGQVIDKAGYTSIGTGLGLKVAEQTPVAQSYIVSMIPHSITEWAAVASILGALSLVAKNLFEMWWKIRESKNCIGPSALLFCCTAIQKPFFQAIFCTSPLSFRPPCTIV